MAGPSYVIAKESALGRSYFLRASSVILEPMLFPLAMCRFCRICLLKSYFVTMISLEYRKTVPHVCNVVYSKKICSLFDLHVVRFWYLLAVYDIGTLHYSFAV